MDNYLIETEYINYTHPVVQNVLEELQLDEEKSIVNKAIKLFYYVRDNIQYSIQGISLDPETFKASYTLQQQSSYCIPKAVVLATLGRAVGIPTRLHMVNFINHRLEPELEQLFGTKLMAPHSFVEMYLNNTWMKLTPALDKNTCERHGFITSEFDGNNHAMLHAVDIHGNPHVEYVKDYGTFADLPLFKIQQIFAENYGNMDPELLEQFFGDNATSILKLRANQI